MNYDQLMKLPRPKLEEVAIKVLGVKPHHKAKSETIAQKIMEAYMSPPKPVEPKEEDLIDPRLISKPVAYHTPSEVENVLQAVKAKRPDFHTIYHDEEHTPVDDATARTVRMEYRGEVRTYNLSVPLRWLRNEAEQVAKGALVMRTLNEHFDNAVVPGKYSNKVMG